MKPLLTQLLLSICSMAFGQLPYKQVADQNKKEEPTFRFDALNAAIIKEDLNADRYKHNTDSAKWEVVRRMLQVNGINPQDVSDSTRITPEGIFLKLKTKKK